MTWRARLKQRVPGRVIAVPGLPVVAALCGLYATLSGVELLRHSWWEGRLTAAAHVILGALPATDDAFSLWKSRIEVRLWQPKFSQDPLGVVWSLFSGAGPQWLDPKDAACGWWLLMALAQVVTLGLLLSDPGSRRRLLGTDAPQQATWARRATAVSAYWLLLTPALGVIREVVFDLWLRVEVESLDPTRLWIHPYAAGPGATLGCLMVAAVATLALARWAEQRPKSRLLSMTSAPASCRTCFYAVGELARCPECGDADPRGPGRYFLTQLGAWIHANTWRRWGLRAFVVGWIVVAFLAPAIGGWVQMTGIRAGWW